MKLKGWNKLILQVFALSVSMMALSLITDTDFWMKYFTYSHNMETLGTCPTDGSYHYHWNYRAFVYFLTGFVYFVISVIRIAMSHKEEDFKSK